MPPQPATKSDGPEATGSPLPGGKDEGAALPSPATTQSALQGAAHNDETHAKKTTRTPGNATDTAFGNAAYATPIDKAAASDETLMAALCGGDDSALAPLMQRWELSVKGFLLRLGVPAADVEDIAQEAFVRLYIKRSAYRTGAPFKPWLLTLAANLGRNRLRWRLRRRESSIDAAFETADGSQPVAGAGTADIAHALTTSDASPSLLAERRQRRQAVRAIIDALPQKLRAVAVCVDLEELSYAEAAQVLSCSIKAVETRLRRARERIRKEYAQWLAQGEL